MKEQIKNLTIQARKHADSLLGKGLPDMVWQDEYNQKFAELIVKECAGICEEHHAWTARMVGNQIKDHFGVEE